MSCGLESYLPWVYLLGIGSAGFLAVSTFVALDSRKDKLTKQNLSNDVKTLDVKT